MKYNWGNEMKRGKRNIENKINNDTVLKKAE